MNTNNIVKLVPRRRMSSVAAAVAAVMILISGSVYAAATLGVFDRFMTERDPLFGSVVTAVEEYVIDQGIRVDVIAAQSFANSAILYISVQDVSGQNRVTENVQIVPHIDTKYDDTRFGWGSIIGTMETMYFDNETSTAYFEIQIHNGVPISDVMDLIIKEIVFESRSVEADFPVALSDMTAASTMPNPNFFADSEFPTWDAERILVPSKGEKFPEIPGDGWISNVAIINGQLHVQIATSYRNEPEHGMDMVMMSGVHLTAANGDPVFPVNQTWLQVDKDLKALSIDEQQNMTQDDWVKWADKLAYQLTEVVFPINVRALDSYTLTLSGGSRSSIGGDWSMTVHTSDSSDNIKIMPGTIRMGNALLESVAVSPLGVSFEGIIDGGIDEGVGSFSYKSLWLETPAGNILVKEYISVGFSTNFDEPNVPGKTTFDGFVRSDTPVDVTAVTAVIIGDVRIAVE